MLSYDTLVFLLFVAAVAVAGIALVGWAVAWLIRGWVRRHRGQN